MSGATDGVVDPNFGMAGRFGPESKVGLQDRCGACAGCQEAGRREALARDIRAGGGSLEVLGSVPPCERVQAALRQAEAVGA